MTVATANHRSNSVKTGAAKKTAPEVQTSAPKPDPTPEPPKPEPPTAVAPPTKPRRAGAGNNGIPIQRVRMTRQVDIGGEYKEFISERDKEFTMELTGPLLWITKDRKGMPSVTVIVPVTTISFMQVAE